MPSARIIRRLHQAQLAVTVGARMAIALAGPYREFRSMDEALAYLRTVPPLLGSQSEGILSGTESSILDGDVWRVLNGQPAGEVRPVNDREKAIIDAGYVRRERAATKAAA